MSGSNIKKEVCLFFSSSNQLVYGLKMGHKIKAIRQKLDVIGEGRRNFNLEVNLVEGGVGSKMRDQTDSSTPKDVIGREADKEALLKMVLDSNHADDVSVISIVGLGGLGKTTLAQVIFNDERVNSCFDLRIWVWVSDNFDVKAIVQEILGSIMRQKLKEEELDTLKILLGEKIGGKRYLLVLDDVWNEEGEKWYILKKILRDGARGSKIIVTTRLLDVGRLTSTVVPYHLQGLSDDEAWSLFKRRAFGQVQAPKDLSLEEVRSVIVRKCGGVPLAIKTIGRMLSFKDSKEEWLSFLDKQLPIAKQAEGDIMPRLKLSYDHLPSHLKHCFAYCSLFPKDYRIDVETLIQLWIAQGFVSRSSHARECLEDLGLECFKDLLWRSIFQEVEYDKWGNVKTCKMHDLMHDLATSVGKGESYLVLEDGGVDFRGNFRHVSFGFNLKSSEQIPTELSTKAKCLRTFLLPCQDWGSQSIDWETILHDFRGLRALDLHQLELEKLPASWGMKLMHLRYLDLSYNRYMRILPNSITQLQNLLVLKLNGCSSLSELPKGIRKVINLGHLDCNDCDNLRCMPRGLGQLTSLWRLTVFVVGEGTVSSGASKHKYESGGLDELQGLNKLRGCLEIKNLGNVRNGEREIEAANLKGKNLLQSLHLDWGRRDWKVVDIDYEENCFQRLEPHPNLKGLKVEGYGGVRFPSWFSSLTNLVKITLTDCGRCRCLPEEWLQNLTSLRELEIKKCPNLKSLPQGMKHQLTSLRTLGIGGCPQLEKRWRNKRGADWPVISHIPNIEIGGVYIQRDGRYLGAEDDDEASSISEFC